MTPTPSMRQLVLLKNFKQKLCLFLLIPALISLNGCGGAAEPDKFPDPGHVIVEVHDDLQNPVPNVICDLKTFDLAIVWRTANTGADGSVEIGQSQGGILPSDYKLVITPPAGFVLAANQLAAVPVTVVSRQTVTIQVHLIRSP